MNNRTIVKSVGESKQRIPLVRTIIIFCVVVTILNGLIVFRRSIDIYADNVKEGQKNAQRLLNTLSDHINLTFLAVDISLKRAVDRQYFNELFGNNLQKDMQNNFTVWVNGTPQIAAMLMADENGNINAIYRKSGYKTWMGGKENVANLSFFKVHKRSVDSELLYVGRQSSWIKNHDGFVILSRRLHKLNGKFGGVVLAAINSDYINHYFSSVISGKSTKLILMRNDYQLLINQITDDREIGLLTNIIGEHNIISRNNNLTVIHEGTKHSNSFDDKLRLFSFGKVPNLDILLSVVTYGEDIFKEWRRQRINDLMYMAIFVLFVLVISFFVIAITKQMQKARKSESAALLASQAKSDFLANMSHELRTPLNAIIGFSEMLEAGYFGKTNNKQKERIHDINYCGTHLLELINDILEFSKGEAGKIELHLEKTYVPKIIKDSARIFIERAKREGVEILTTIPDDLPALMADSRKLKQILLNLLSNAIKFTGENGTVEVTCGIDEDKNFVISVTDTGIGIKEDDIPKALSAFGQIHHGESYGGTGLGLPLCKLFVNLHGGDLTLHSIINVGTKVTVVFPANKVMWSASDSTQTIHEDE